MDAPQSLRINAPGGSWGGAVARNEQLRSKVEAQVRNVSEFAHHRRALEDDLARLRREHDELKRVVFEAAQTQRRLCGPRYLRRGPFEVAGEIFPAGHLSGDLVTVLDGERDLVLATGDIAGKGLPAALWFAHLVGMIRLEAAWEASPAAALWALNRDLCRMQLAAPLTSLFLARLNLPTGEVVYSNAGHPPALLLSEDSRVESLAEGGPLLGVLPEARFVDGRSWLQPGDTLLGYSDGITECCDPSGEEFGIERLIAAARRASPSSCTATLFSVLGAVEDFAGNQPRKDDLAVLVARRTNERSPGSIAL